MDERARRLAQNEAFFRSVNERIKTITTRPAFGEGSSEYVCECSNTDCTFHIELSVDEYEAVRSNGAWFAIVPHHALPEIEDVVEKHDGYWVVSKRGDTGEYTKLLDPRTT